MVRKFLTVLKFRLLFVNKVFIYIQRPLAVDAIPVFFFTDFTSANGVFFLIQGTA